MAKSHKQHHYVPAGYLRSFASRGRKGRLQLHILDLHTGKWRRQSPGKVCKENRFYAVELPSLDENLIETGILQRVETDAAPVFRRLERDAADFLAGKMDHPTFPNRAEEDILKAFMALMWVRTVWEGRVIHLPRQEVSG